MFDTTSYPIRCHWIRFWSTTCRGRRRGKKVVVEERREGEVGEVRQEEEEGEVDREVEVEGSRWARGLRECGRKQWES